MSGGVDSSVACALLVRAGYEVIGITLRLWTPSLWAKGKDSVVPAGRFGGCCSPQDLADAKMTCAQLGIPHYTFDWEEKFNKEVVENFTSEYLQARTPNPCVRCNAFIKFDALLKVAKSLDADCIATGHYARISITQSPNQPITHYHLCKAADEKKDQSYFLYTLNQEKLSKTLFPLGEMTKTEVRKIAGELSLPTAEKLDSQDICFLEGGNYKTFLQKRLPQENFKKGKIQTRDGKIWGEHQGLAFYTIGQRENLGVSVGRRLYVIKKDHTTNTLVVGEADENFSSGCFLESVHWCSGQSPAEPLRATVKIRYRHSGTSAMVLPPDSESAQWKIQFDLPEASVTPGQSAVFYDGEVVLGGGVICETIPLPAAAESLR